jgi:hypothetical protein
MSFAFRSTATSRFRPEAVGFANFLCDDRAPVHVRPCHPALGWKAIPKVQFRLWRLKLLVVAVLLAITSLGTGAAPSFTLFVVAHCIRGGRRIHSFVMYVAEISPLSVRRRIGPVSSASIVTGILISYAINYLLRGVGPANWRWMFITAVPIISILVPIAIPKAAGQSSRHSFSRRE